MPLNKGDKNVDERGDKPPQKARDSLKFPTGNAHWEDKAEDVMVADTRYASEMGTAAEYKASVDGLANYVKRNKMKY